MSLTEQSGQGSGRGFADGDIVVIRGEVPTWGGRSGVVERVSRDGSCQVRLSTAALLWFDKWELCWHSPVHDGGLPRV